MIRKNHTRVKLGSNTQSGAVARRYRNVKGQAGLKCTAGGGWILGFMSYESSFSKGSRLNGYEDMWSAHHEEQEVVSAISFHGFS